MLAIEISEALCADDSPAAVGATTAAIWRFEREGKAPVSLHFGPGVVRLDAPELSCRPDISWHVARRIQAPARLPPRLDHRGYALFFVAEWKWKKDADGAWVLEPNRKKNKWAKNRRHLREVAWDHVDAAPGSMEFSRDGRRWVHSDLPVPPLASCVETTAAVFHDPDALMALDFELRTRFEVCAGPGIEFVHQSGQAQKQASPSGRATSMVIATGYGNLVAELSDDTSERCDEGSTHYTWRFVPEGTTSPARELGSSSDCPPAPNAD